MAMSGMSVVFSVLVLNIHHKGVLSKCPPRALKGLARALARLFCMKVHLDETTNAANYHAVYSPANFTCKSHDNESLLYNDMQRHTPIHVDLQDTDALNDVMNQNMPQSVPGKSNIDIEILNYFKQMMANHEQSLVEKQIVREWQEIARVMDKAFFWLFLSITVLSTIFILVLSPMTKDINLEDIHHVY
jgi:nicotinic acetylcholine receptor